MKSTTRSPRTALVGVGSGFGAAIVGYLLVYLSASGTIQNSAAFGFLEAVGSELSVWQVVGWVFLNAHGVTTLVPGLFGSTSSVNLIETGETFSTLLYAVPVVCLLVAGAVSAALAGAESPADGALSGAAIALGYLVVALAGLLAFPASFGGSVVRPDPVTTVLLAGVTAPVALGAIGGSITATLRS
ncbi:transporter [Halogeometricum borinquense]|uniref:Transporter n=1 Tax=Halogeometricum borinquense TaxID=60847 RepID=A0A482TK02_9EURY|nr:transporter [Halogeometricum borinquense]RYJ14323.1 transporter [Halogeometricum borinquense]